MKQYSPVLERASGKEGDNSMPYEAPTIVRYGSVAGLTASQLKCTPGEDFGLAGYDAGVEGGGGSWNDHKIGDGIGEVGQDPPGHPPPANCYWTSETVLPE